MEWSPPLQFSGWLTIRMDNLLEAMRKSLRSVRYYTSLDQRVHSELSASLDRELAIGKKPRHL
ncbi:Hypothetical Protein RSKD131_3990 [Cereibacter sphaeroides KD131]|nr:Hypothetical Protein RSKD131_3990 [Cereibacter sphaeroides KD131]